MTKLDVLSELLEDHKNAVPLNTSYASGYKEGIQYAIDLMKIIADIKTDFKEVEEVCSR